MGWRPGDPARHATRSPSGHAPGAGRHSGGHFSQVVAGPYRSLLLGDLGADVIKVEQPGVGDDTRPERTHRSPLPLDSFVGVAGCQPCGCRVAVGSAGGMTGTISFRTTLRIGHREATL